MELINRHKNDYRYFEVWLDYIEDLQDSFLNELQNELHDGLILLFRRQQLEPVHMHITQRHHVLTLLHRAKTYVDLDISTQKDELEYIQKNELSIPTIVSYHNYAETPEERRLTEILEEIALYKPTITKIATFCQSEKDALYLLAVLLEMKRYGRRAIVLGMGEFGVITRIFGTLWGNEMIFAPEKHTEKSAPGQLTRLELEFVFKTIAASVG